jgi:hypothetical protein
MSGPIPPGKIGLEKEHGQHVVRDLTVVACLEEHVGYQLASARPHTFSSVISLAGRLAAAAAPSAASGRVEVFRNLTGCTPADARTFCRWFLALH